MPAYAYLTTCADWSDRIFSLELEQASGLLSALYARDLFQQGTIHASLLRIHHATKLSLLPRFALRACLTLSCSSRWRWLCPHLIEKEFLVFEHFLFSFLVCLTACNVFIITALNLMNHVVLISFGCFLFTCAFLANLMSKYLIQSMMLSSCFVLIVDVC